MRKPTNNAYMILVYLIIVFPMGLAKTPKRPSCIYRVCPLMCPLCPHCVESRYPCMDTFGSNATPMGGAAGRADAMIGAVEAKMAEG
jgi:hypothetical protein